MKLIIFLILMTLGYFFAAVSGASVFLKEDPGVVKIAGILTVIFYILSFVIFVWAS